MKKKKPKKKLTAYEITELIIKAVVAAAALITAIKWWWANSRGAKAPPPQGEQIQYNTKKGELQEFMKNFWFITLCALLIIAASIGLNIPLRIAIIANAILISIDIIKQIWRFYNGTTKKKN